jgi:hypothetical protein
VRVDKLLSLRQRIRKKSAEFDFTMLIDGVDRSSSSELTTPSRPQGTALTVVKMRLGKILAATEEAGGALSTYERPSRLATIPSHAEPIRRRAQAQQRRRLIGAFALLSVCATFALIYIFHIRTAGQGSLKPGGVNDWTRRGLPDPALTPGERGAATIAVMHIPDEERRQIFASYGVDPHDTRYVLCQLIPGKLQGTISPKNLFPTTPWFQDLKSRLDSRLVELVQSNQITVERAETELQTNWVQAMHAHYVRNYGEKDAKRAREKEETLHWGR